MSWEEDLFALFDDLEQQAEALYDAERGIELADRSRAEYAGVSLVSRLMASLDREVRVEVVGVGQVNGILDRVAGTWCLVRGSAQDWVVPLAALSAVSGASDRSTPDAVWSPVARLGLGSALRRLAEAGERCVLHQQDGSRHDGVLGRVGKDFVEVLTGDDHRVVLVALGSLAAVQSRE